VGVEGVRLVEAALGSGLPVEAILLSPAGRRHLARLEGSIRPNAKMLHTSDRLFAWIADTHSPQGIAALVRPKTFTIETLVSGVALTVVLVGVQDPGNVGTLVRAAEAFGATGVATCSTGALGSANPLLPKALRASAGSALRIPIVHGLAAGVLLAQLRAAGLKLFAAVRDAGAESGMDDSEPRREAVACLRPWEADWKSPAALVIGNEGAGLPAEIVRMADACVSIPQAGASSSEGVESLNAAMAGTVLLYEVMRQRGGA
jgi:TrmH family RNA methyltransferase